MIKKNTKNMQVKARKQAKILGIKMDSTFVSRVLARVRWFISHNSKFYIVTPNPELVLMAQDDEALKKALNGAKVSIPDGIGLSQANKFLSLAAPKNKFLRGVISFGQGLVVGAATFFDRSWLMDGLEVIKGREVVIKLIALANKMGWRVFFLGGRGDEAEKAAYKLRLNYKKIRIESFKGPELDNEAEPISEVNRLMLFDAIVKINDFKPHLLFVAFGNPKQEKWIRKNLGRLKIGGAMAVGGTFRYIAGYSKLPPKWMEKAGLEWIWRLLTEPRRIKRIFNAWPVFPWRVFLYKIRN